MTDAELAVDEEPPWSPWRDTALVLLGRGASARRRSGPGGGPVRRDRRPRAAHWGTPTRSSTRRDPSSRCLAMDRERLGRGGGTARAGSGDDRRAPHARLRRVGAGLRRRREARGAPRRPRGGDRSAHARDACPAVLHVRRCPGSPCAGGCRLAKAYGRARPTRRPLATCCARSTTSSGPGRRSASLVDEVSELRESSRRARRQEPPADRRSAPRSCGSSRTCRPTSRWREIAGRLFVSRNTVRSQVGSIYRKLGVSSRSDAVQQATSVGLLGG